MKMGSLCSGYEGLGMAVEAVFPDAELAWVSDIDKGACKVLAHRFPDVPNIGDMTAVDWTQVEPVDVITGGTPCQDLSHAGKRAGMTEGTRSNLWVSMREAIATIRPALVVWENVGGAYSAAATSDLESRKGRLGDGSGRPVLRALGRVLGDLASLGYVGGWHGLRAADVGAPHGRLRVFVVAVPAADAGGQARIFGSGLREGDPSGVGGRQSARGGRSSLLPTPRATGGTKGGPNQRGSSGDRNSLPLNALVTLLPTPAVNDMGRAYTPEEWDAWTATQKAKHGNGNGHGKSLEIEAQRLLATPRAHGQRTSRHAATTSYRRSAPSLEQQIEIAEGRTPSEIEGAEVQDSWKATWGDYAAAIARWEHTLGRPAPAPTMLSTKGNPQLSPAFTEWMMGLPAGWITDTPGITRNEALKLCGNGVVPQQAAAAIRFLLNAQAVAA